MSVLSQQSSEGFTLEEVSRSGTEVETSVVVVGERGRGVGGRHHQHASLFGHLVDELKGHTGRCSTHDGRYTLVQKTGDFGLVGLVVQVTRVAEHHVDTQACACSVDVGFGQCDTGFFRGSEEGEASRNRKSSTDCQ